MQLPRLAIARAGPASVAITWTTNASDYLLEWASSLSNANWYTVTNSLATNGNVIFVTLETAGPPRFYRLRKP